MKYFLTLSLLLAVNLGLNAQKLDHVQGDLLVQLAPGHSIRPIAKRLDQFKGRPTNLQIVENSSEPLRIWLLHFDWTSINERDFLDHVRRQPGVELAQFNHLISMRETVPDDPIFASQWQWVNTGQGGGTPDADVDADLAWDITTGGSTATGHDIVICVTEGTNRNHPDLQGNLWVNAAEIPGNGIDDDNNGYVDDYNGWNTSSNDDGIPSQQHGTQVSGMIGAKGNNDLFATGINWDVKIMNVEFGGINEANVVEAYTYPLVQRRRWNQSGGTQGAFVVATNSSWGIDGGDPADSPLWCAFYDSLGVEGILSCGATANNNVDIDQVLDLPTACTSEYMVAVTATNNNDVRTFSGYGTTHIDVAAPGGGIVTISTNGGPSTTSGTSFATPLTAGVIGLMYSIPCSNIGELALADPAAAALQVRDALYAGVDIIPNLVNETKYGGRVNAFNSLNLLLQNCGPCPKPYNVQVSNILDVSAAIQWVSPDSSLTTDLRYRIVGDTAWTVAANAVSPFELAGLQACTSYEFQLQENCASDSSGFANSVFFTTDGCCVAPENLTLTELTTSSALFGWGSVLAANSYNIRLISALGDTIIFTQTENNLLLAGLTECTNYEVQVQTVCDTGATDFTLPIAFTTLGCGACRDISYCPTAGGDTEYEWIESVQIGFINNTSGNDGGYGDFTGDGGPTTELLTFTSNPVSLTPGFSGGTYPEWFVVYIDFNQDGDFGDTGEKAFDSGMTVISTITGNIVVPGTAAIGSTRMRVVMRWNSSPAGPCAASFNNGEVEDYCVSINAGVAPNCAVPINLAQTDSTLTSATIAWETVGDAGDYSLQYRKVGLTAWNTLPSPTNSLTLPNLETCEDYEVRVRSNCTGTFSDYSSSIFVKTSCLTNVSESDLAAKLGLSISPNPFTDDIQLGFRLDRAQSISIELTDALGRSVYLSQQDMPAGTHQLKLSPALVPGVYGLKLKAEDGQLSQKLVRR